jgi:ABC-2 type transport system ATP-binding protein
MIEIKNIAKSYGRGNEALRDISLKVDDRKVFGLVGTNGAGKSTLLRIMAGVVRPDSGEVIYDGKPLYTGRGYLHQNISIKQSICFLSDTWGFPIAATASDCADEYAIYYPYFNRGRFDRMMEVVGFDEKKPVRFYSKGMKKATAVLLGLASGTRYLLCDELFDGLDPVLRQTLKSVFAAEMTDRDFTPVIASHNLRELEDFCDHVGLLHKGGVLLSENLGNMQLKMHRIQCVIGDEKREQELLRDLNVVTSRKRGSVLEILVRGDKEQIASRLDQSVPIFSEILPVSLEEAFIGETEESGYDFKSLFS